MQHATAAAAHADTDPLAQALSLVFAQLDGDVSALCASACVSKQWLAVLMHKQCSGELWHTLRVPRRLAPRLSDAQLASLVARARGGLRNLDLSGCVRLTNAGLKHALANQVHLVHFAAVGCYNLSSEGVARALTDRRLDMLLVRGVATGRRGFEPAGASPVANPAAQMVAREVAQLRRRLKIMRLSHLDASAGCTFIEEEDEYQTAEMCGYLCGDDDRMCDCCLGAYRCIMHGSPADMTRGTDDGITRCLRCKGRMCASCMAYQPEDADFTKTCGYCRAKLCPNCITSVGCRPLPSCAGAGCLYGSACDPCVQERGFVTVYVADAKPGKRYYLCDSADCCRSHAQRRAEWR